VAAVVEVGRAVVDGAAVVGVVVGFGTVARGAAVDVVVVAAAEVDARVEGAALRFAGLC
jgi:hypothetical protein